MRIFITQISQILGFLFAQALYCTCTPVRVAEMLESHGTCLMIEKYEPIIESDGVERPRCLSRTVHSPTCAAATMTIDRYDHSRIFRMHVLSSS